MNLPSNVPEGLCRCGCGGKTKWSEKRRRFYKYMANHQKRLIDPWIVDSETGCWLWLASLSVDGYGKRLPEYPGATQMAHRWVYERFKGVVDRRLELDHLCKVRRCVNPDHLEPVPGIVNYLRGNSPCLIKARANHCKAGHPYTEKMSTTKRGTHRCCWVCLKQKRRATYLQKKAKGYYATGKYAVPAIGG